MLSRSLFAGPSSSSQKWVGFSISTFIQPWEKQARSSLFLSFPPFMSVTYGRGIMDKILFLIVHSVYGRATCMWSGVCKEPQRTCIPKGGWMKIATIASSIFVSWSERGQMQLQNEWRKQHSSHWSEWANISGMAGVWLLQHICITFVLI